MTLQLVEEYPRIKIHFFFLLLRRPVRQQYNARFFKYCCVLCKNTYHVGGRQGQLFAASNRTLIEASCYRTMQSRTRSFIFSELSEVPFSVFLNRSYNGPTGGLRSFPTMHEIFILVLIFLDDIRTDE